MKKLLPVLGGLLLVVSSTCSSSPSNDSRDLPGRSKIWAHPIFDDSEWDHAGPIP